MIKNPVIASACEAIPLLVRTDEGIASSQVLLAMTRKKDFQTLPKQRT